GGDARGRRLARRAPAARARPAGAAPDRATPRAGRRVVRRPATARLVVPPRRRRGRQEPSRARRGAGRRRHAVGRARLDRSRARLGRPRPDERWRGVNARGAEPDAVTLALYRGLFAACAEGMGAALMRAAHSPNITERLDHSCAVFDSRARLVAQAAHIPVHLGSMPRAVEAALALAPFQPGDAVLLNDPYDGGTHLPDLTLVSPV